MPPRDPHITATELKIMNVLWRLGTAAVRDVREELVREGGESYAYTTVMTLMNQLAEKGVLAVDRSRQPFVYRAAVKRERVQRQRLRDLLRTLFDGQAGELVLRLVEEAELSPADLKRIEARIEALEREDSASGAEAPGSTSSRKRRSK